jgi:hypothetical protein
MSSFDIHTNSATGCQPHCTILQHCKSHFQICDMLFVLFGLAIAILAIIAPSIATSETAPDPNLCAKFRRGSTVDDRVAVYSQLPTDESVPFRWLDIEYRPEYLFHPLIGGVGQGPKNDILFEMYIDGQPLPIDGRGKILPAESQDFGLLLTGLPFLPLERTISIYAHAPDDSKFSRSGEIFHGYERVEVENRKLFGGAPQTTDIFIEEDATGRLIGVLICDQPGTKPVPSCQLHEVTEYFQVKISRFQLDQMGLINTIKRNAREFTMCLTYREP